MRRLRSLPAKGGPALSTPQPAARPCPRKLTFPWRSAQIRTGSFPAYGSYLGWLTAKRSRASILGLLGPDCLGLEVEQDQTCHGAVGHAYPAAICCSARGDAADHLPSAG